MAMSLENAQLHHDLLEKERLEREMAMARGIQRSLLPETSPVIPGFDIAVLNEPCFEVGGDYYDFLSLGPTPCWWSSPTSRARASAPPW